MDKAQQFAKTVALDGFQALVRVDVVDTKTQSVVKSFPADKRRAASNYADKKDTAYGAVRYAVRYIWAQ